MPSFNWINEGYPFLSTVNPVFALPRFHMFKAEVGGRQKQEQEQEYLTPVMLGVVKMTEVAKEGTTYQEIDQFQEDGASSDSEEENSSFLPKLNLLIIVLSMCSISSEDGEDHEENNETKCIEKHEAKDCVSRSSHNRRRELHKVNLLGRQARSLQPMNKDCRHGRRM